MLVRPSMTRRLWRTASSLLVHPWRTRLVYCLRCLLLDEISTCIRSHTRPPPACSTSCANTTLLSPLEMFSPSSTILLRVALFNLASYAETLPDSFNHSRFTRRSRETGLFALFDVILAFSVSYSHFARHYLGRPTTASGEPCLRRPLILVRPSANSEDSLPAAPSRFARHHLGRPTTASSSLPAALS
jgi:hypothetical protein